jgi:hypothetical protein
MTPGPFIIWALLGAFVFFFYLQLRKPTQPKWEVAVAVVLGGPVIWIAVVATIVRIAIFGEDYERLNKRRSVK